MSLVLDSVVINSTLLGDGVSSRSSVRVSTTSSGTLSTSFVAGSVVDDITLALDDRILITQQVSGIENGVYVVTAGTPIRATDCDIGQSMACVTYFVEEGTLFSNIGFICTNNKFNDIVGTDALTFVIYTNNGAMLASNSSTDNAIVRYNGTTGNVVQNSNVIISDTNVVSGVSSLILGDANTVTVNTGTQSGNGTVSFPDLLSGNDTVVMRTATQTLTNKTLTAPTLVGSIIGTAIYDSNTNEQLGLVAVPSAVNELSVTNSVTSVAPELRATGNDTNISLQLTPKGTGSVITSSGTVSSPSYSFIGDTDTGLYRTGANTVAITVGGANALTIGTSVTSTVAYAVPNGTTSAPSYSFSSDPTTGLFWNGVSLNSSIATVTKMSVDANSVTSTVPYRVSNGTASVPSYSFSGSTDSGLFYTGTANTIALSTAGVERVTLSDTTVTSTLPYRVSDGTAGAPSYSFSSSTGSGLFYTGTANTIALSTAGVARVTLSDTIVTSTVPYRVNSGTAGAPSYSFSTSPDSGLFYTGTANTIALSTAGVARVTLSDTTVTSTLPYVLPVGSATVPSYTFTGSTTTGLYSSTVDTLAITTGGTQRVTLNSVSLSSTVPYYGANGTVTAPTYSFSGSPSTGMYASATNTVAFATSGTERVTLSDTTLTSTVPYIAPSGSVSVPSYTFTGSSSTGMYASATNTIGFTVSTTLRMTLDANSLTTTVPYRASNGSASVPSYSFSTSPDSGLFYTGVANTVALSTAGVERFTLSGTTVTSTLPYRSASGTAGAPSYSFSTSPDSGLFYTGVANTIALSTAGVERFTLSDTIVTSTLPYRVSDGTAGAPSYSFSSATTSGLFYTGVANTIALSTAGVARVTLSDTTVTSTLPYRVSDGTAGAPSYSFSSSTGSGLFYTGTANTIALSTAGVARVTLSDTTVTSTVLIHGADGSVSTPSYSFSSATSSGLFYTGTANTIALATNGTSRLTLNTSSVTSTIPYYALNGTVGAPSYSFTNSNSTGMYYNPTGSTLTFATNGTIRVAVNSTSVDVSGLRITTVGTPTTNTDATTKLYVDTSALTTKGDIMIRNTGTVNTRLPVGTDGLVLTADSAQSTGLQWRVPVPYVKHSYNFTSGSVNNDATTWLTLTYMRWNGFTDERYIPTDIYVYFAGTARQYIFRVIDLTNGVTICTSSTAGIASTTPFPVYYSIATGVGAQTVSNVTSTPAIWILDIRRQNGTGNSQSVTLYEIGLKKF